MNDVHPLASDIWFRMGPVEIAEPVVITWALMVAMVTVCWLGTRNMTDPPGRLQAVLEVLVQTLEDQIRDVVKRDPRPLLPLVGTLFIFLVVANLSAVLPGVDPPTAAIETPAALALIVFLSIHAYGIQARGVAGHFGEYLKPTPFLLPLNLLSDFTRTFSMTVRLFGNTMSHELVVGVVLVLAGLLVPVPLMVLTVLIGIIQAYIFAVLATVFLAAAIGTDERALEST